MFENKRFLNGRYKPLKIVFFLAVFLAFAAAVTWIVMFLWNTILTDVTSVKPIKFWQAAGLLILSKILFGGFGKRKPFWKGQKGREMKEKWMHMNSDERQEAKNRWKAYCETKKAPKDN